MSTTAQPTRAHAVGRFGPRFLDAYLRSLADYRAFYDDVAEIGDPRTSDLGMYFVPGISGVAGQMRMGLPSLARVFGTRMYMKSLFTPAFAASQPIWDKYTVPNTDEKLARLRDDLIAMLERFRRIMVVCSSNGLYDFLAVSSAFPAGELEERIDLAWVSCAPDHYKPTVWQNVFYPMNGVEAYGHPWFAYPNHNLLKVMNPEVAASNTWREGAQVRTVLKADVESRFWCMGLQWAYVSTAQLGDIARHVAQRITRPWEATAEVLIADNDGYWQGVSHAGIESVVRKYVPKANCAFRPGSHLGVVNPPTLTEVFTNIRSRSQRTTGAPTGFVPPVNVASEPAAL